MSHSSRPSTRRTGSGNSSHTRSRQRRSNRDDRTDLLAQLAAKHIRRAGEPMTIAQAIDLAIEETQWHDARRPTPLLVRRHARGMAQQALGQAGYLDEVERQLTIALNVMLTLEDFDPCLVGRAAKGLFDADPAIYLHIVTNRRIGAIAGQLVEAGYEEPEFTTAHTPHHGRFDRISFGGDDGGEGVPVTITRLTPAQRDLLGIDLFTGKPIANINVEELRNFMAHLDDQHNPDSRPR